MRLGENFRDIVPVAQDLDVPLLPPALEIVVGNRRRVAGIDASGEPEADVVPPLPQQPRGRNELHDPLGLEQAGGKDHGQRRGWLRQVR